ncbi:flagellar hook-length control protein FliK [Zoogloea sp.]|uniref:flagellar hook-length control protein FliK n=1 Tax=Zoogloea sp. TaxID=49181 RepID=UPI0035AFD83D
MIPSDLAARLRMLTEASFFQGEPSVAPLARVKGISDRFPDFTPGQRIVASLHATAADNTYLARVDGREVTLALPQSVKAGDTLELVVSHVTPRAVFATLAQPTAGTAPDARPALSQAGKLISFLLTGQPAAATASLAGGEPLLPAPPASGAGAAQLAARLGSAVGQSGLFYESHQARWIAGQLDTASLRQEPQGRLKPAGPADAPATAPPPETAEPAASAPAARPTAADTPSPIPERLVPLVHQQLDAIATQHMVWQGQVWPGQMMEWEIEDPEQDRAGADDAAEPYWNTTLRLSLPSLGGVEARLHLTPAGVAVRLIADSDTTRDALDAGQTRLADALAAANVPLTGLVAERRSPP